MKKVVAALLAATLALTLVGCGSDSEEPTAPEQSGAPVRVGSLLDAEGTVLGSMIIQMLEANDIPTEDKTKLGTPDVVRTALLEDEIDATIDYTGSGQYYHEGEEGDPKWKNAEEAYAAIRELDRTANGLEWLTPAPANNSEFIATTKAFADAEGIETMEDFAEYVNGGGAVKLIGAQAWFDNPLGLMGYEQAYGFELSEEQLLGLSTGNTAEMLSALARGTDGVNFSLAYGTDGQLAELDLVIIKDSKDIPPVYEPTPVFRADVIESYPSIPDILEPVFASLDQKTLQALNARVAFGGEDPKVVAREYLEDNGFLD